MAMRAVSTEAIAMPIPVTAVQSAQPTHACARNDDQSPDACSCHDTLLLFEISRTIEMMLHDCRVVNGGGTIQSRCLLSNPAVFVVSALNIFSLSGACSWVGPIAGTGMHREGEVQDWRVSSLPRRYGIMPSATGWRAPFAGIARTRGARREDCHVARRISSVATENSATRQG